MKVMAEKQDEQLNLVKAMKKSSDSEYFDLSKCCHTVSSTNKYVKNNYITFSTALAVERLVLFNNTLYF
jgi:hypothetical protein